MRKGFWCGPLLYWLGCGLITAAWLLRPALPESPLWDPDTWGYLYPALSWLDGTGFQQMHGRAGFYPSLLILILQGSGSIAGIAEVQHVLGWLGALLAWSAWWLWLGLLPGQLWKNLAGAVVGMLVVSLWMFNPHAWLLEQEIRPEGMLNFFVFGQLFFAVLLFRLVFFSMVGREVKPSGVLFLAVCGAGVGLLVFTWAGLALKPSWILVAGLVWVGLAGVWWFGQRRWAVGLAVVVGGAFWLGVNNFYKGWMLPDNFSKTFLPMTLTTIHAPWVLAAWEEELALGKDETLPLPREVMEAYVQNFRGELARAREDVGWYGGLGHDPDLLMYRSSINEPLGQAGVSLEESVAMNKRGYLLAWRWRPWEMGGKVISQFDHFLRPDSRIFAAQRADWPRFWERTALELARLTGEEGRPVSRDLLEANRRLFQSENVPEVLPRPSFAATLARVLAAGAPWILGCFAVWLGWVTWRGGAWRPVGWITAFLLAVPAANAFAVSLTHCLELTRYLFTFAPFYALGLAAAAFLIVCWLVEFGKARGRVLRQTD